MNILNIIEIIEYWNISRGNQRIRLIEKIHFPYHSCEHKAHIFFGTKFGYLYEVINS